jgi:hypothetical protein
MQTLLSIYCEFLANKKQTGKSAIDLQVPAYEVS